MVSITYLTSLQSGIEIGSSIRDEISIRGMEAGFSIQDELYKSTDGFYARERKRERVAGDLNKYSIRLQGYSKPRL